MRRVQAYANAFNDENPETSIPLILLAQHRVAEVAGFYGWPSLVNFRFLINPKNGYNDSLGMQNLSSDRIKTYLEISEPPLETEGIFVQGLQYNDYQVPGNHGVIKLGGLTKNSGWVYVEVDADTVVFGPNSVRQSAKQVTIRSMKLKELVYQINPEVIYDELGRYIGNIHHWQKQGVERTTKALEEFEFDRRMLEEIN